MNKHVYNKKKKIVEKNDIQKIISMKFKEEIRKRKKKNIKKIFFLQLFFQ